MTTIYNTKREAANAAMQAATWGYNEAGIIAPAADGSGWEGFAWSSYRLHELDDSLPGWEMAWNVLYPA